MERKLVSIQTIDAIDAIAGADNIQQARVMGWTVVIKKGEFAVGMRPRDFRVRTVRLRGVLSQGLALPVAILGGLLQAG